MLARAEREAKRRAFSGVERAGAMRMGGEGRGGSDVFWKALESSSSYSARRAERRETRATRPV